MTLLALAAGTAFITPAANAAPAANGELLLGFRATGGEGASKNYVINLGQAAQFNPASTTPLTLTTSAAGADLTSIFGSEWFMHRDDGTLDPVTNQPVGSDVLWGIGGTTGSFDPVGSDPAKTLYGSRKQLTPGTQSAPWLRKSDSTQGSITTKMQGMYGQFGSFNVGTPKTQANSVSQNTGDTNSWSSYMPGGTTPNSGPAPGISFAFFGPSVEASFANGTAGSFLDLYRVLPATNSGEVDTNSEYLGRLIANDSGVITFIPLAAFGVSTMQLSAATGSVSETAGTYTVTVTRSGDVSSAASVQLSTADNTALGGTDFTAISNQVVSFGVNETSKTVAVTIANRVGFQADRDFNITLGTPTGGTVGTTGTQAVTIQEFIEPSVVKFSSATFSANQNDTMVNVTITRTGGSSPVTVAISTANGTGTSGAVAGTDYTAITNQTVNIPANTNSVNVAITLTAPTGEQPNKQFSATLSSPGANASLGSPATTTVRILANDNVAPTVKVTKVNSLVSLPTASPIVNGTLGGAVPINGEAFDAKGVEKVQVSIDNGVTYNDATLSPITGGVSWVINVRPPGGLTTLLVKAIDGRNLASPVVTKTFTYVVKGSLTVVVTGPTNGTLPNKVTGGLTGSIYEVGKTYTLTAVPANAGIAFDNWSGPGLVAPATQLKALTFTYTAVLAASPTITATFVTNPFATTANVAGAYNGLIKASTGTKASNATNGHININITAGTGDFTGTVKIDGSSFGATIVKGVFDNAGVAKFGGNLRLLTTDIPRTNKTPYVLSMTLNTSTKQITGTLKERSRTGFAAQSEFVAERAHYSATVPVPADLLNVGLAVSGTYTAVLPARSAGTIALDPADTFANSEFPQGDGVCTVTLTKAGVATFTCFLGDGTNFTATAPLTSSNRTILFSQLYTLRGSIGGDIDFTVASANGRMAGSNIWWFRPYQPVQHYPYGWPEGIQTDLVGSEYSAVAGTRVLPGNSAIVPTGNCELIASDGQLSPSFVRSLNISNLNVVTKLGTPADPSYGVVIATATGMIGGAPTTFFTHSNGTKPAFRAVILQQGSTLGAYGHFLTVAPTVINGLGESGGVSLLAKP